MQQLSSSLMSNSIPKGLVAAELEQSRIGYVQRGLADMLLLDVTLPFSKFGIRKPSRYYRRLFA